MSEICKIIHNQQIPSPDNSDPKCPNDDYRRKRYYIKYLYNVINIIIQVMYEM